jgi:hypothetical protein
MKVRLLGRLTLCHADLVLAAVLTQEHLTEALVANRESISNRFGSARGVAMN